MARAVFERERGNFIDLRPTKNEPASVLARVVTLVNLDANQMSLSRDEPIHPSNATFPTVTTTHARTVFLVRLGDAAQRAQALSERMPFLR